MRKRYYDGITGLIKYCFLAVFVISSVSACVTAEDEALFVSSMLMAKQGSTERAYKNLQGLCRKFPDDKRFCVQAMSLKQELYGQNMNFVKEKLDGGALVSKSDLITVGEKLKLAKTYETGTAESYKYELKLKNAKEATDNAVSSAVSKAQSAAAGSDYFTAYNEVSAVKRLEPAMLGKMEDDFGFKAINSNMPVAEKMIAEDNWKEAKELLAKMASIDPGNKKIIEYMALADKNDTPDFYMTKGNELKDTGELAKALSYYMKALAFPDARQAAQRAIDETRVQLIEVSFLKGVEFADQELNKQAYDNFMSAFSTMKGLPIELRTMVSIPKDELEQYYDNMFFLGQKAMDEGAVGQAYLYYKMLYDLVPSYHGLRAVKNDVENKVLARALKSIAVIPFKSPANEPELGLQVTSNIMQILQNSLNDDVKIIERGALEILLREYELAVAGSISEQQSNPDSFRIKSADYLLMGEVLDSRTESNVQNSKKKVRVKIGEKKGRNIEWEDWDRAKEKLLKEKKPVPPEPARYVMEPVYDYAEYDVAFHEKVSYLSISYRVVETSQGRITYSNTVRSQKEARDEATSGIDLGSYRVDMKAANLPTDIELSNIVRKETIDKISSEVMDLFKNQDDKYLSEAEKLESSNNLKEAVEMYVNAILLKIRKNKDVAEIEDKAGKYLDVLSVY